MKPIRSILTIEELEDLASRSNFRYGKEILKNGEFIIEKENAFNLIIKVKHKNSQTRTVELMSTSKGLRWKCTCTGKKDYFCQHCVAAGLTLQPK
jgi:hypothetical protein